MRKDDTERGAELGAKFLSREEVPGLNGQVLTVGLKKRNCSSVLTRRKAEWVGMVAEG